MLLLLAAIAISPAMAVTVTYTTTGSFSTGAGTTNTNPNSTNIYTDTGGLQITFLSYIPGLQPPQYSVNVPPVTAIDLGALIVSGPTSGSDTITDAFTLTINQSAPVVGSESFDGGNDLTGTITLSNSGVSLVFTQAAGQVVTTNPITGLAALSFTIGGALYYVDQVTQLDPVGGGSFTELQGAVTASALPEPAFYGLTGAGLAGLMLASLRRRRQQQTS